VQAVTHEDGQAAIGVRGVPERAGERQIGRERDHSRERLLETQGHVQGNGAALREAGEHDAIRLGAGLTLEPHVLDDAAGGLADARLILGRRLREPGEVAPRPHAHPAVERHRPDRRVREDEARHRRDGEPQLRHDRHEIVAVRPETVQPDHAGIRSAAVARSEDDTVVEFLLQVRHREV